MTNAEDWIEKLPRIPGSKYAAIDSQTIAMIQNDALLWASAIIRNNQRAPGDFYYADLIQNHSQIRLGFEKTMTRETR